jgi:hypothetical protein
VRAAGPPLAALQGHSGVRDPRRKHYGAHLCAVSSECLQETLSPAWELLINEISAQGLLLVPYAAMECGKDSNGQWAGGHVSGVHALRTTADAVTQTASVNLRLAHAGAGMHDKIERHHGGMSSACAFCWAARRCAQLLQQLWHQAMSGICAQSFDLYCRSSGSSLQRESGVTLAMACIPMCSIVASVIVA